MLRVAESEPGSTTSVCHTKLAFFDYSINTVEGGMMAQLGTSAPHNLKFLGSIPTGGRCGHCGRVLYAISAYTDVGLEKGPFCLEFACFPCVP